MTAPQPPVNICRLDEFRIHIAIAGLKDAKISDVKLLFEALRQTTGNVVVVQLFDANLIATWQHLYFSALNALTAFANKTNISNNLAMETLLYASAQKQITKATEMIGIKPKTSKVAVLVVSEKRKSIADAVRTVERSASAKRDDSVLELSYRKAVNIRRLFGISEKEISAKQENKGQKREALVDLVIEHVALLAAQRK